MLKLLQTLDQKLARIEYWAMVVLMAALTLMLVAQVLLRYVFNNPIFWAEDVAVQILVLATCIGVSHLIYQNDMLKVDFLLAMLPEKAVHTLQRLIVAVGLLTMLLVCVYAVDWLLRPENRFLASATTGMLKWYNHLGMVVCFHLMAWHLLVKLLSPKHTAEHAEESASC